MAEAYSNLVTGDIGVGKTTLLAHLATTRMIPPLATEDLIECKKEIRAMRQAGWSELFLEEHVKHLVYVIEDVFTAIGMGYRPRVSMELTFDGFQLFDENNPKDVARLLPGAYVFIPEFQRHADARKWQDVDEAFLRLMELLRKNNLHVYADTQIGDSAEKRFRGLSANIIKVLGQEHFYEKKRLVRTVWNCLEFPGINAYMRYCQSGSLIDAEETNYEHHGNIFACLDSFNGKAYFYNGMKGNYTTKLASSPGNDRAAMLEHCKNHPLFKKIEEAKKEGKNGHRRNNA